MSLSFSDMKSLTYFITSLTPIVTGDHDHRNTELLPSGLLGSLRYQYWLLKAMQAWQENPKSPVYPPYSADLPVKTKSDSDKFTDDLSNAGPVVQLFGATNWKKMFRLEIADAPKKKKEEQGQLCSARSNDRIAPHHWRNFNLTFRQDRPSPTFDALAEKSGINLEDELHSLMSFVHHYGWLGAAPQNGLGWVRIECDNAAGKRHEIEKTGCVIPPPDNPVFFAKDVVLSAECFNKLLTTLREFYLEKILRSERMISYYHNKKRLNREEQKDLDNHKNGITRYKNSLMEYIDGKNGELPPVGYEVRRWLKQKNLDCQFFNQENNDKKYCNYVHVSHPFALFFERKTYRLRLRCCTRPNAPEDPRKKVALLPGITPNRLTPSQMIAKACENLHSHEDCAAPKQQENPP